MAMHANEPGGLDLAAHALLAASAPGEVTRPQRLHRRTSGRTDDPSTHPTGLWVWSVPDPVNVASRLWAACFDPTSARTWSGPLLVALAGQLPTRRSGGLVIGIDANDLASAATLRDARLELSCWYRESLVAAMQAVRPFDDIDEAAVSDLPLPHRHGARHAMLCPVNLRVPAGAALVSSPVRSPGGPVIFVDPAFATTADAQTDMIHGLLDHACTSGVARVAVTVGPGEPQLDHALASMGFERSVDWGWLRPR